MGILPLLMSSFGCGWLPHKGSRLGRGPEAVEGSGGEGSGGRDREQERLRERGEGRTGFGERRGGREDGERKAEERGKQGLEAPRGGGLEALPGGARSQMLWILSGNAELGGGGVYALEEGGREEEEEEEQQQQQQQQEQQQQWLAATHHTIPASRPPFCEMSTGTMTAGGKIEFVNL